MVIKWKVLIIAAAVVAAMFAIAAPLGDSHHGIGKHNHTVADLGNVLFGAFLVAVAALIVLIIVALIQYALRSRRAAGNTVGK